MPRARAARVSQVRPRRFRPALEELERRLVLSVIAHNTAGE